MLTNNDQHDMGRIGSWSSQTNWTWVGLVLVCCAANPCLASAQEEPLKRQTVEELIRLLDAPTLSERSQAERRLLDLGPVALANAPVTRVDRKRFHTRRIGPQNSISA